MATVMVPESCRDVRRSSSESAPPFPPEPLQAVSASAATPVVAIARRALWLRRLFIMLLIRSCRTNLVCGLGTRRQTRPEVVMGHHHTHALRRDATPRGPRRRRLARAGTNLAASPEAC